MIEATCTNAHAPRYPSWRHSTLQNTHTHSPFYAKWLSIPNGMTVHRVELKHPLRDISERLAVAASRKHCAATVQRPMRKGARAHVRRAPSMRCGAVCTLKMVNMYTRLSTLFHLRALGARRSIADAKIRGALSCERVRLRVHIFAVCSKYAPLTRV